MFDSKDIVALVEDAKPDVAAYVKTLKPVVSNIPAFAPATSDFFDDEIDEDNDFGVSLFD